MPKNTETEIQEAISTSQRVSIGLISISLSLISLSLGIALFSSSGAVFFAAPDLSQNSTPSTATAVTLNWTAPGDDGSVGTANAYDIRVSTTAITEQNYSSATQLTGEPSPQIAGSTEAYTATNLSPSTTYYFALKTSDEAGNVSALSNVATKTTSALAQACVPTYQCTEWSVCTNGSQTRTCSVTNGCPAGLDAPATSQVCTAAPAASTTISTPTARVSRHILAVGTGIGTKPLVRVLSPTTGRNSKEFAPFSGTEKNGTNVTAGEFTGDQLPDIAVGTGAGTNAKVRVFTDRGVKITEFNPYSTQAGTGVSLVAADVDGDGRDELITVPAKGPAQVRIFKYNTSTKKFSSYAQGFAFSRTQLNGYSVAAADLNLDGRAEIIVAPRTRGRTVTVWKVTTDKKFVRTASFSSYPITPTSGITLSTGDINGDGRPEILTTMGPGYWSDVKAFDQRGRLLARFEPASRSFLGGVDLTAMDVNNDGRDEVITGTYLRGDPGIRVFRYDGATKKFKRILSYAAYPTRMQFGLRLGSI